MTTVVAILDRKSRRWNSRTDVLIVVDGQRRRLTWIPRDLYTATIANRINEAYRLGGPALLAACLGEHGFIVDHVACISRSGAARWLEGLGAVTVPVESPLHYRYPLAPELPIEAGGKDIAFLPPMELLEGERIHQWLGARYGPAKYTTIGGDLDRCRRQQIFLSALLERNRPLPPLRPGEWRGRFGAEIFAVRADWSFETLDALHPDRLAGRSVLRRPSEGARALPRWHRGLLRLRKLCTV